MGASYTNITLKGPSQAEVVDALRHIGHAAWVSPTHHDITVAYPRRRYFQGHGELVTPARRLSELLHCVALAVEVHDSDTFCYQLFETGKEIDVYDSNPSFGYEGNRPPMGGNAFRLCAAFDELIGAEFAAQAASAPLSSLFPEWRAYPPVLFSSNAKVEDVEAILRRYRSTFSDSGSFGRDTEHYVFEEDRHKDLALALDLPPCVICAGYEAFEVGILPEGLENRKVVKV